MRHNWRKGAAPRAGRVLAACGRDPPRYCRGCLLRICAQGTDCLDCNDQVDLPCQPVPKRRGPPEQVADLTKPRRVASQRLVRELAELHNSQYPCPRCRNSVFRGDSYCRHCGFHLPWTQPTLFDTALKRDWHEPISGRQTSIP